MSEQSENINEWIEKADHDLGAANHGFIYL
jgi:hypothetical protein